MEISNNCERPIVVVIGTEHESPNERIVFDFLNRMSTNKGFHWLCEGESDGRDCQSIKNRELHLVTDGLFLYMVIRDLQTVDDPTGHPLYAEFVGRLIELLVTINRLPDRELRKLVVATFNRSTDLYEKCRKFMSGSIDVTKFQVMETFIRRKEFVQIAKEMISAIKGIMEIAINHELIPSEYLPVVERFLDDPRQCAECEDLLFMKMRDDSFMTEIGTGSRASGGIGRRVAARQRSMRANSQGIGLRITSKSGSDFVVFITVGEDHVEPLVDNLLFGDDTVRALYAIRSSSMDPEELSEIMKNLEELID